jgi:hypothetical protein
MILTWELLGSTSFEGLQEAGVPSLHMKMPRINPR